MGVEAIEDLAGDNIQGLSLNLVTWIRHDGWPPMCGIPDKG
jgi:hypothetical protein